MKKKFRTEIKTRPGFTISDTLINEKNFECTQLLFFFEVNVISTLQVLKKRLVYYIRGCKIRPCCKINVSFHGRSVFKTPF